MFGFLVEGHMYVCTCTVSLTFHHEVCMYTVCKVTLLPVSLQDIANYTRVQPHQREMVFKKFVERVNFTPKVQYFYGYGPGPVTIPVITL